MLIQILGTGCPKCKQLTENAAEAVRLSGLECRIEKVTDLQEISAFGVLSTPGLVLNGKVQSAGKLLLPEEIKALLVNAAVDASGATVASAEQGACSCGGQTSKVEEKTAGCCCGGNGDATTSTKNAAAGKVAILVLVLVATVALLVMKATRSDTVATLQFQPFVLSAEGKRLPRMLEFGSTSCVPCKMMEPVLQSLQTKHKEALSTEFYNVELVPDLARTFKISMIPAQVFLSPDGKELFRHEGFFPEEDILAKWAELGYKF